MRLTLRRLSVVFISIYCLFTIYAVYYLLVREVPETTVSVQTKYESILSKNGDDGPLWNPWEPESVSEKGAVLPSHVTKNEGKIVEIWGKAAIGQYLWQHIFNGILDDDNELIQSGSKTFAGIEFRYFTGPGLVLTTAHPDVTHLVLVLNGREPTKIETAKSWLNFLPNLTALKRAAVLILADEGCNNEWLQEYRKEHGGLVDLVFVVYDSVRVDGKTMFQWPLGVATYRRFPFDADSTLMDSVRPHRCNFAGTVYENSSRVTMMEVLQQRHHQSDCLVRTRRNWEALETESSMQAYVNLLLSSDLTLCPVGRNTECYRIYEAMSMGSVPVVEDVRTTGQCANNPLRLLKEWNAPIIYLKSWSELEDILNKEATMTMEEKIARRKVVLRWYKWFKDEIRYRFITLVDQIFFE